jgi:hypothetical protein
MMDKTSRQIINRQMPDTQRIPFGSIRKLHQSARELLLSSCLQHCSAGVQPSLYGLRHGLGMTWFKGPAFIPFVALLG